MRWIRYISRFNKGSIVVHNSQTGATHSLWADGIQRLDMSCNNQERRDRSAIKEGDWLDQYENDIEDSSTNVLNQASDMRKPSNLSLCERKVRRAEERERSIRTYTIFFFPTFHSRILMVVILLKKLFTIYCEASIFCIKVNGFLTILRMNEP